MPIFFQCVGAGALAGPFAAIPGYLFAYILQPKIENTVLAHSSKQHHANNTTSL